MSGNAIGHEIFALTSYCYLMMIRCIVIWYYITHLNMKLSVIIQNGITGIRVDVTLKNGETALGLLTHASLEKRYVRTISNY